MLLLAVGAPGIISKSSTGIFGVIGVIIVGFIAMKDSLERRDTLEYENKKQRNLEKHLSLTMEEIDQYLYDQFKSDTSRFYIYLEVLIDRLLCEYEDHAWSGKFKDSVDGFSFIKEDSGEDLFSGHGSTYILSSKKEYVEPVSIDILFDFSSKSIKKGRIKFGMVDTPKPKVDSGEASDIGISAVQMRDNAVPIVNFKWRHEFQYVDGQWLKQE